MRYLIRLWRRWRCAHRWHWFRNIYGDEINATGARSVWACYLCGAVDLRAELQQAAECPCGCGWRPTNGREAYYGR